MFCRRRTALHLFSYRLWIWQPASNSSAVSDADLPINTQILAMIDSMIIEQDPECTASSNTIVLSVPLSHSHQSSEYVTSHSSMQSAYSLPPVPSDQDANEASTFPCRHSPCSKLFTNSSLRARHERATHKAPAQCTHCYKFINNRADYKTKHARVCRVCPERCFRVTLLGVMGGRE